MAEPKTRGRPPYRDVLTPAEWRTIEWVRHGLTNPEIARLQSVSVDGVKFHVANALQKLGFHGRQQLRTWNGVRCDSNLSQRSNAMSSDTRIGSIGQIARSVVDIVAAEAWYRDVLQLPHLYTFGNLSFFDMDGVRLFLSEGDGGPSESVLYFNVADIQTASAALQSRGVDFINAPHLIHRHADGTEEWMAFFKDNEGRTLGLMSQVATDQTS